MVQREGWGLLQGMRGLGIGFMVMSRQKSRRSQCCEIFNGRVSRLSKRWLMVSGIGSSMWLSDGFSMPSFNASIAQGFRFSTRYLLQMTSASSSQLLHPLTNDLIRYPQVSLTPFLWFLIPRGSFSISAYKHNFNSLPNELTALSDFDIRIRSCTNEHWHLIGATTWRYLAWSFRFSNDW